MISMNKAEALTQIITFGELREQAFSALAKPAEGDYGNGRSIEISDSILTGVLQKFICGCISADDLEEWAVFVECRDDINIDKNEGYVYALANPELMGEISTEKISKMLAILMS